MLFSSIAGLEHIKKQLIYSADNKRIAHAQLFVGSEGCGLLPMAIAYAQYILCGNTHGENNTGNESCNLKFNKLSHPDLHFYYPVSTSDKVKKDPVSSHYLTEWIKFVEEHPYGNLFNWLQYIGIEKKQGLIGKDEAREITKNLSLKSYEGGYKIAIIWMAEKMNSASANTLLKLIEEPPEKTIFLLLTEDEDQILQTIKSRCQIIQFPPLPEAVIAETLIQEGVEENLAKKTAHRAHGNLNKARELINEDSEDLVFERWFIIWVRSAFKAKGNKKVIHDLLTWSDEISKTGRETQKKFLSYCLDVFRQALLMNYNASELTYMEFQQEGFKLEKFAPFVHGNNIATITSELEDAMYHIERNGNAKIILTDLSIKLTRLLHTK